MAGGTSTGGTYDAASGAVIDLTGGSGNTVFTGTYTGSGAGTVQFIVGEISIGNGGATFNFPGNLFQWDWNESNGGAFISGALGDLTNLGTMNLTDEDVFDNDGTLFNYGTIITNSGYLGLHSDGVAPTTFVNEPGASFLIQGVQGGIILAFSGETSIDNEGTILDTANGTDEDSSVQTNDGTITNTGTIETEAGVLVVSQSYDTGTPPAFTLDSGTWIASGGGTLVVPSTPTTNGANLQVSGSTSAIDSTGFVSVFSGLTSNTGQIDLQDGAAVAISNSFSNTGFTNSGTITLGPAATMNIHGPFTQSGVLDIQLGGTPASGQFGSLTATGAATLGGTLQVSVVNGYSPTPGDGFTVVSYPSSTGAFSSFSLPTGQPFAFQPSVNATSVTLTAVTPSDLAVQSIDTFSPAAAAAGQTITVTFTVVNLSAATIATSWTDSVFLSSTTTLGANAVLLGRAVHQGALADGATDQATVTGPLPGVLPGSYYAIVEADSQHAVADSNYNNNTFASTTTLTASLPALTLNAAAATGTIAAGQNLYYQITVPAGQDVQASLSFGTTDAASLLEAYNYIPTTSTYDNLGTTGDPSSVVSIAGTQAGTYYLLVQGQPSAGAGTSFSLSAQSLAFGVQSVSPSSGGNGGSVTLTITGSQFTNNTTVNLVNGGTTLTPAATQYQSSTTIYATFNLTSQPAGQYTVTADTGGQSASASVPFTVIAGGSGNLSLSLSAPGAMRPTTADAYALVDYSNTGTDDLPAPLLQIIPNSGLEISLTDSNFSVDPIEVLAYNPNGPAGVLSPGASGQIKVYLSAATLSVAQTTAIAVAEADPTATIDWSDMESQIKPSSVSTATWDEVFGNFTALVGSTEGSLQTVLDQDATYLSQFGQYTGDLTQLLSFEMQQADGFGQLDARFTTGVFGIGRTTYLDATASTDGNGDITILDQGLVLGFVKQTDGTYDDISGTGDTVAVDDSGDITLTDPFGNQTGFLPDGQFSFLADAAGLKVTAAYAGGKITGLSANDGETISFTTNSTGQITGITDSLGDSLTLVYSNQLLSSDTRNGMTTSFTYVSEAGSPSNDALASITYADGTQELFQYDTQGRLVGTSAAGGADPTTIAYNLGHIRTTDALGDATSEYLNEFGEVAEERDPLGNTTMFQYSPTGVLEAEIAPDGSKTTFTDGSDGAIQTIVNPLGGTTQEITGGPNEALSLLTDPLGDSTTFSQNAQGETTSLQYANGEQVQYQYDSFGNVTTQTSAAGQVTNYTYNSLGQVTNEHFADGTQTSFTYDSHGNIASETTAAGTTSFTYNAANQMLTESAPGGHTLAYTYNSHGQLATMTDQTGYAVDYKYNSLGQLSELDDSLGNTLVTYTYDAAGRLSDAVMSNGSSTQYTYDAAGNITNLENLGSGSVVVSQFAYTYNSRGQRISMTTAGATTDYAYDFNGQLTNVTLPGGEAITYAYDGNGNLTSVDDSSTGTTTYAVNNVDQYTSAGSTAFTYDANGNLTTAVNSDGTTTYTYDAQGQLAGVTSPSGTWSYQYDAMGNLVGETANGQTTTFVLDPLNGNTPMAAYNGSGQLVAHYVSGLGLVAQVQANGNVDDYAFDAQGNTADLTGPTGSIVDQYSYLPFGQPISSSVTVANPFTYVGRFGVITDSSGLSIMGARTYDPSVARFIQRDPLGFSTGSTNLYTYADNDPVDKVDPNGRDASGGPAPTTVAPALTGLQQDNQATQQAIDNAQVTSGTPGQPLANSNAVNISVGNAQTGVPTNYTVESGWDDPNLNNAVNQAMNDPEFSGAFVNAIIHGAPPNQALQSALNNLPPAQQQQFINIVFPHDPNNLFGPAGYGSGHYILPGGSLLYTVDFENESTASAPAQTVVVTETLDSNLDPSTFQFGDMGFGNTIVSVPAGLTSYQTTVDLPSSAPAQGPMAWMSRSTLRSIHRPA